MPMLGKDSSDRFIAKGTSIIRLATAAATTTAAIFANAEDQLSNCVENPSQYNYIKLA